MRHKTQDILVEADGIICQTEVPQDEEAGEEHAQRDHLEEGQAHGDEQVEGRARGDPEGAGGAGEMPHGEGDLHVLELGVSEDPAEGETK